MRSQVTLILVVLALGLAQAANPTKFAGTWKLTTELPKEVCGIKGDKIYTSVEDKKLILEYNLGTDKTKCLVPGAPVKLTGDIPEEGNSVTFKDETGEAVFTVIGEDKATLSGLGITFQFERTSGGISFIVIVLVLVVIAVGAFIFIQKKEQQSIRRF